MITVDEKEEEVRGDSINDCPHFQVVVGKKRRDREREIVKKRGLKLGFPNGMLQVLPPLWEITKMTVKNLINNWYVGNQR